MAGKGKRGPAPSPDAIRRNPPVAFNASKSVLDKLDKLAARMTGGNRSQMLRLLIEQAHDPEGGEGTTPGQKLWLVRRGGRSRRSAPIPQPAMRRAA